MYFRLMGKLSARRKNLLEENEKGFTLIELLVVVLIIGVLAAIAIPVYLGVQASAQDNAAESQVTNAKTALIAAMTNDPTFTPPTASPFTIPGYTPSTDIPILQVGYTAASGSTPAQFCISAGTTAHHAAIADTGAAKKGYTCAASGAIAAG